MRLGRFVGFSGALPGGALQHPSGDLVHVSSACIVITGPDGRQEFLRGHDDAITCLRVSSSGALLASGQTGANSDVLVWDYASRRILFRLSEHDVAITAVAFSADERLLVTFGSDNKVVAWDLQSGWIVGSAGVPEGAGAVHAAVVGPSKVHRDGHRHYSLCTIAPDRIALWDLDTASGILVAERVNTGHLTRKYTCIDADGDALFVGTGTGDVVVLSHKSSKVVDSVSCCSCGVQAMCAVPGALFVGSGDGSFLSLSRTGANLGRPSSPVTVEGAITSIGFAEPADAIYVGTDRANIYKLARGAMQADLVLQCHSKAVVALAVPRDMADARIATSSLDGTIRVWSLPELTVEAEQRVPGDHATCLAFTHDVVISGWAGGSIRSFDSETKSALWAIPHAHKTGVSCLVVSKQQKYIVSGGTDGEIRVWEIKSRELISQLKQHKQNISRIVLLSDDVHCLSAGRDRSMMLWDLPSEKRVTQFEQKMGSIHSMVALEQTGAVATVGQDKSLAIWDLSVGQTRNVYSAPDGSEMTCLSVDAAGQTVATGSTNGRIHLWDVAAGVALDSLPGHVGPVNDLAYTGSHLVSVGADGCVIVWSAQ